MASLETQKSDASLAIASSLAKIQGLDTARTAMPETMVQSEETGGTNTPAETLRTRLTELRLQMTDLQSRYLDSSRSVQDIREQIGQVEALLAEAEAKGEGKRIRLGLNANREKIALDLVLEQANMAAQRARLGILDDQIAEERARIRLLNENEPRVNALELRLASQREKPPALPPQPGAGSRGQERSNKNGSRTSGSCSAPRCRWSRPGRAIWFCSSSPPSSPALSRS